MAGATFARIKTWTVDLENLTNQELDAEIQNILDNLLPAGIDDYSVSTSQMRIQTTPGAQGSESLATSLAGELERLRYVINRITGETYWYDVPDTNLADVYTNLFTNDVPNNRIISGRTRSATDGFPIFLQPHGTNATVTLKGATTNFKARINGVEYTVSSDVAASVTLGPSAKTCLLNDSAVVNDKNVGETDYTYPTLTIDTVDTAISNLTGKFAAFKVSTEYFVAFVNSATSLTNVRRGFCFDSSDAPIVRVAINDNDTITLMMLNYIFLKTDGTLTIINQNNSMPVWAYDQPTSPSSGDYWFDLDNDTWKTYSAGSWTSAGATLIGIAICDSSGCKAARSFDFWGKYSAVNTVRLEKIDANTVRSINRNNAVSVGGYTFRWDHDHITWEMAGDLESGLSEENLNYYTYITENGDTILGKERPYERPDLQGRYHPYHIWRCVGRVANSGGSFLDPGLSTGGAVAFGDVALSATCGSFTTVATSYTDVTNLNVILTTRGGPILILLVPDGSNASRLYGEGATEAQVTFRLVRGATVIGEATLSTVGAASGGISTVGCPPGAMCFLDTPPPGRYQYAIQAKVVVGTSLAVGNAMLKAMELPLGYQNTNVSP